MPVPGRRQAYSPVRSEYLEGVLVADVQWAFVNLSPLEANLSILGVLTEEAP
jgi:hypothetical protein